jgi:hypothetical protein
MRVLEYSRLIGIPVKLKSCVSRLVRKRISVMTAKMPAKQPVCNAPRISRLTTVSDAVKPVRDLAKVHSKRPNDELVTERSRWVQSDPLTTHSKIGYGF